MDILDVVKLKDGRIATILEKKDDIYLVEIESKGHDIISIKAEDIDSVIK